MFKAGFRFRWIWLKLLSIAATAALLSTGAMAVNTINIGGEILPSAVVGFDAVNGETLGTDRFMDATIELGSHEVDAFNANALSASEQDIYVKTNIASGGSVTMAITSANNGALVHADDSSITIPVAYKIGGTTLSTDGTSPVTIASAANDGSTATGDKFTVTPTAAADQLAGTYNDTLTVAIVAI